MELNLEKPHNRVLGYIIEERARMHPDKTFLLYKNIKVSYGELNQAVNRLAHGFLNIGIGKDDKVSIMLPNCPEFLYTWFALAKIGAVEVPVNTAFKGDFLSYIVNNSDSKILVIDEQFLDRLKFIENDLQTLEKVIVVRQDSMSPVQVRFPVLSYSDIYASSSDNPGIAVQHTDIGSIMYTSGTTGPSKGVLLDHNCLVLNAMDNLEFRQVREDDVFYTCLPFFHANAQGLTAVPVLLGGVKLALGERFSASGFWDEMRDYGVTQFNGIGAMMEFLWKQPPGPSERNHKVRLCLAGPIPAHVYEKGRERWGLDFLEGFGLSETGMFTYQPLNAFRPGSCGKATAYYEVKIVDDNDEEVSRGTIGEIICRPLRPYSMMSGYYKMPEKTLEAFKNLWFHTGDYGKLDEDGYLYFVDRKKDAIRRRGENISSFEVERIVNANPKVAESAAVAVPSEVGEDEVKICVILKPGEALSPEELLGWCEERIPHFALPRYIEFYKEFPKTGTLRTQKHILREAGVTPGTWDRDEVGYKLKR